jgi:amidase
MHRLQEQVRALAAGEVTFSGVRTSLDPQLRAGLYRLADVLAALGHDVICADPRYGRAIFGRVDVVLAPTTARPPLRIGATDGLSGWQTDKVIVGACPYAWPWNVLGWPAVNVPAGFTSEGLPFGAQLLGPANSEALLISLAAQLEAQERWYEHVPPGIAAEHPSRPGAASPR